jgi:hypothetical protein
MEGKPNPELYERLSAPFESADEARAAVDAFCEKVAQLREQYKMPNVTLNICLTVKANGEVQQMTGGCTWGDNAKALMMAKREFDRLFDYWRGAVIEIGRATEG